MSGVASEQAAGVAATGPEALPPLAEILSIAEQNVSLSHFDLAQRLRAAYSECHFTVCGENDVSPRLTAMAENPVAAVYFLTSNGHCLSFTSEPVEATGLLVAMKSDD